VDASRESAVKPPVVCLWLLRTAAWLAPPDGRAEWNERWTSRLWNLWILIDRGELAVHGQVETARLCRDAIKAAFWMRFNPVTLRRWWRGPGAVLTSGAVALLLLALLSHGFRGLRELIYITMQWKLDPRPASVIKYDPRADFVVGHFAAIVMALLVGVAISTLCGRVLQHSGWKYWAFLGAKLLLISLLLPLAWIELGGFARAHIPPGGLRVALATVSTLSFFGAFGCSVIWAFADQRQRCPDCLGYLALPVTIGSWASVFNPVTTEMICDEGHGSLTVAENEMSGDDRWVKLDASWKEF
jgi:hypothetical protein